MFIYITYDKDGFITAYQNTEADGYGGAAEFMVSGTKITVTSGHSSLALSSSSATIRGLKHADCRIYYSELI